VDSETSCPGKPLGRPRSSILERLDMPDPDMKAPVAMSILDTLKDTPRTAVPESDSEGEGDDERALESDSEGECDDEKVPSRERDDCLRSDECDERLKGP
jgi:hypothetical protein